MFRSTLRRCRDAFTPNRRPLDVSEVPGQLLNVQVLDEDLAEDRGQQLNLQALEEALSRQWYIFNFSQFIPYMISLLNLSVKTLIAILLFYFINVIYVIIILTTTTITTFRNFHLQALISVRSSVESRALRGIGRGHALRVREGTHAEVVYFYNFESVNLALKLYLNLIY